MDLCSSSGSMSAFYVGKTLFQSVFVLVPILLIFILSCEIFKYIMNYDNKEDFNKLLKRCCAKLIIAVLIFFVPSIIKSIYNSLDDGIFDSSSFMDCYNSASEDMVTALRDNEEAEKQKRQEEYEERQKQREEEHEDAINKMKEAAENDKNNNSSSGDVNYNYTYDGNYSEGVINLFNAAKKADNFTYTNGYKYGTAADWNGTHLVDSSGNRVVACDRGVGLTLYYAGYVDNPLLMWLSALDQYLPAHGWTKITNISDLQPGDIVFYDRNHNGYMNSGDHTFIIGETLNQRYDWGSDASIQHTGGYSGGMPISGEINASEFGWAYRMPQ